MARIVALTPLDRCGRADGTVEVNLNHVLWMEPQNEGTRLYINDIRKPGKSIINSSLLVAESESEILCAMEDERARNHT